VRGRTCGYPCAVSLTLVAAAAGQSCLQKCMDSSAQISGMTYQHKYELCEIRCKGKDLTSWGAIAYSKKDKIAGWSFQQVDRASAEGWPCNIAIKRAE